MAGEDIQGSDAPRADKDAKTGAPKKKLPDPGKTTNTDAAGVTPGVPGKRTNTDGMDGANGAAPGKTTQVDASGEGKEGKEGNKDIAKAGGSGGGKDTDGDHNLAAGDGKQAATGPGKGPNGAPAKDGKEPAAKAKAAPKTDAAALAKGAKEATPLVAATSAAPAQRVDVGSPATLPTLAMLPPRPNKNLSDKWAKETGRTVEQHHEQIQNELNAIQADVTAKQAELAQLADAEITKVTADITQKVQAFTTTLIVPGKQRVEAAYSGLGKGFEGAEQKALADIAKQKAAGKAAIDTAKTTSGDAISKKLVAAKAVVGQTIAKNVPAASGAIKKWTGGIPAWVKAAKDQAKTAADTASKQFDPKKGNTSSKDSAFIALSEDIKRNHVIKHGDKLGKQYEAALIGWSKDTDKKADELVRKALDASKVEFEAALDTADKSAKKGFDDAIKTANTTLDTGETGAKKAVTDAKTNGIKRFDDEKKESISAADKAGKEFTDTTTAAGTELTDRIKKKANDDSKNYAALLSDLQAKFKSPTPMQFEQAKPKIDAAKAQLQKLHETNRTELTTLVTEGKNVLVGTLTKQQETYEKAVADRETSAKKTEAEVIKQIGAGVTTMSASIAGIGTSFTEVTTKESQRVELMVAEFNKNADTATKDFGTKITEHLETSRKGLEDNLKANLEPQQIATDTQGPAQQEITQKKKQLDTDTGGLRSAMDGWGTDENKIFGILRKCSAGEITYLEASYHAHYPQRAKDGLNALRADFADEMDGNDLKIAMSYLNHDRTTAIKLELADSKGFWNDDEARIEEVLRGCSEEEIKFLNTDADAKKVVADVKGALGGADLDMMTTLLDQSMDREDRKLKADAIGLFQAMDGLGTDEAKMKKILEECKSDEDRQRMRAHFNQYAKSKGWESGSGTEDNDALTLAIKDEIGTGLFGDNKGEQNHMLALAANKRDENDIKAAKMVDGADGTGTNEDAIFEALDDEAYAKQWAAASPEDRKKLEAARRKMLDEKVAKMSGGKWDSVQGLIDDEMSKSKVTYQEFIDKKREDGTALTAQELAQVKTGDNLQWMVAQRKLQTGQAEADLMLAYACWGVTGTDEDAIKKVLGPEPKAIAEVKQIAATFQQRWGTALVSHNELEDMKRGEPTGLLRNEMSGKDWFSVRMLLAGKPETAEQLKYVSEQRKKFNKGGVISGALMEIGEAIGYTEAKSTAEATEARFEKEYQEKFGKNPTAKLGTADSKTLEELADYLQQDYEAYSASLNSLVDGIVMALEIVGGIIITVVTAGTASPVLAAIIANLVLSAGTITFKYAALGDQYGAAELGADIVKAVGTSAFAGLGELKALQNMTQTVGTKVAGNMQKLSQLANSAANKAGMKMMGNGALEMGDAATKKLAGIVAAGTKNVIMGAGQEVYNTLTDEKTYDKKLGDALWGEDSIGAKILKGIPKNFVEGAVTQWVNEAAGASNKNNKGETTGPKSNALVNAVSDIAGNTAGFFVYVDNYHDAEQFWMQLLKSNAQKAISSSLSGYAMHKTRSKKLGRDFINGDMLPEGLAEMKNVMDSHEKAELARFVEKYAPDKVASLPDEYKAFLTKKTATPAATTSPQTQEPPTILPGTPVKQKPATETETPPQLVAPADDTSTAPATVKKPAPVVADEQPPAVKTKGPGEEEETPATPVVKPPVKTVKDDGEQEKPAVKPKGDAEVETEAARIKREQEEQQKKLAAQEETAAAPVKKTKPGEEPTEETTVGGVKKKLPGEEEAAEGPQQTKTAKTKPTAEEEAQAKATARAERMKDQEEKGHAGIEVHSHFLGNVDPKTFRAVIEESGLAPMRKANPNGATAGEKIGDTTSWEPVLREVVGLKAQGFGHTYETVDGKPVIDPKTGMPKIKTRGVTGDAIVQAQAALDKIETLKQKLLNPKISDKEKEQIKDAIYRTARSAAEKSMRASDETDFNSSYEVRDELIKKFYGEADRQAVLKESGLDPNTPFGQAADTYRKHYEEAGRPEVVKKIDDAKRAQLALDEDDKAKARGEPGLSKDDRKKHEGAITAVNQQFAYDRFAKDTVLRLIQDGLTYTEQSNSSKKLGERFDPEQIQHIKKLLIAEHPNLKAQIENFQVKHLTMLNTASFGTRDVDGVDTGDIHPKGKGTRAGAKTDEEKAKEEAAFKGDVRRVVEQTKRGDVVGVDIAGAEHFTFDEVGKGRFAHLYNELYAAAVERGQPIVLRPHVGEGANDTVTGKHGARDTDRQMVDGELSHYKRAKENLDALITVLEDVAATKGKGGKLPPEIIVRFGHATHATPQQAARMAKLGIIAEVNLSSNHETGSVSQKKPATTTEDQQREQDAAFPKKNIAQDRGGKLDDHSLANLILNDVPIILSTDGHSVMSTTMKREYDLANKQIDKILKGTQKIPLTLEQAQALGVSPKKLKPDDDGVVRISLRDIPDGEGKAAIEKKFRDAKTKFFDAANDYYDQRPKQDDDPDDPDGGGRGTATPAAPKQTDQKNIKRPANESEAQDAENLATAGSIMRQRFGEELEDVKMVAPPKGKEVLKQGAGDALISLPIESIPPTMDYDSAVAAFQKQGIPRYAALTEKERMHETAFANRMEKDLPNQVEKFFGMSVSADDKNTYQFEVDKAKQLYARYGTGGKLEGVTKDQAETRATANHALHPTAVALARLAFLKRLDEMAAMPADSPYRNIFVTNGGCGAGKGSLFGLAGDAMPGKKFGAVWDAAGEGDASENGWILAAAAKRGIKVTYGFADNDATSNYKGVLDRAESTGRIVDPVTYARSYVKGQAMMKEFLASKEYQDALAAGTVEAIGLNIPELRSEQARHKEAVKTNPNDQQDKNAGKMGNNGYIGAEHLGTDPRAADEQLVTASAAGLFKAWVETKRREYANNPEKLQQLEWFVEGGATNTAKFDPS